MYKPLLPRNGPLPDQIVNNPPPSRLARFSLVMAAFGSTYLIMLSTFGEEVGSMILLFPIGLLFDHFGSLSLEGLDIVLLLVWIFYLLLSIATVFVRSKRAFVIIYLVLLGVLILNIAGCTVLLNMSR